MTRFIYAAILFLGTIMSIIMQTEMMETELKKIPGFCEGGFKIEATDVKADKDCDVMVGFKAVYRINFALAIFFFAFSLLMFNVKTSKDPRAAIHNGFWFFKIAVIVGIMVGSFYIPEGGFTSVWFVIGLVGAALFILIQLVLLVDMAHSLNERCMKNKEEGNPRVWYTVLLSLTSLCYILSIVFVGLLCAYYTKPDDCTENKFFISINVILCIVVSVISIHSKVQEHQPRSGLLQSSVITLYIQYLTWSAMTNEPDEACNPSLLKILTHIAAPTMAPANTTAAVPTSAPTSENFLNAKNILGMLVFFVCLVYSSIRTSSNAQVKKLTLSGSDSVILGDTTYEEDGQPRRVVDNEKEGVQYSYCTCHLMFALASLYIMMTFTSWYNPNATFQPVSSRWSAVWVKISSSWVCLLLYAWTLIAPIILTNRDFS